MGNMMKRREPITITPDDIQKVFEVADIPKVFDYLEATFHLSKKWRAEYKEHLIDIRRGTSEQEFFALFAKTNLEPALKHITKRNDDLIFNLIRYLLKDRIKDFRENERHQHKYYHNR